MMKLKGRVMIVSEEMSEGGVLSRNLAKMGMRVVAVESLEKAEIEKELLQPHLVFVDAKLLKGRDMGLLNRLSRKNGGGSVIIIGGEGDLQTVEGALAQGAEGSCHNPIDLDQIRSMVPQFLFKTWMKPWLGLACAFETMGVL